MRQIKFRGYNKDIGRWFYGDLFNAPDNRFFIRSWDKKTLTFMDILVVKESVGQFTGLTDKNEKEIFEEDIIEWVTDTAVDNGKKAQVEFIEGAWVIDDDFKLYNQTHILKVIGNIYENPKLLEEEK